MLIAHATHTPLSSGFRLREGRNFLNDEAQVCISRNFIFQQLCAIAILRLRDRCKQRASRWQGSLAREKLLRWITGL